MVLILCTLIFAAMTVIIGGSKYIDHLATHHTTIADSTFWYVCLHIAKWLIIVLLYFMAISFLYYLAPSKKSRYKFISPGAIFATIVQILCSSGFSFYLNNFANYNKIYGSLGTIIIVLMLLYFTSISLILGFELNLSIISGKKSDALASVSALSRYTMLNDDETTTYAIDFQTFSACKSDFSFLNPIEGRYRIEVWNYSPIPSEKETVDKLSLALSMKDYDDPRIEKEKKLMIDGLW